MSEGFVLLECFRRSLERAPTAHSAFEDSLRTFLDGCWRFNGEELRFSRAALSAQRCLVLETVWAAHCWGAHAQLEAAGRAASAAQKQANARRPLYSELIWDLTRACCASPLLGVLSSSVVCNGRARVSGELNPAPPSLRYVSSVFSQSTVGPVEKACFVDSRNRSALAYLCMTGSLEGVQLVHALAPQMAYVSDLSCALPVFYAALFGSLPVTRFLVEQDERFLLAVWAPQGLDLLAIAALHSREPALAVYVYVRRRRLLCWLRRRSLLLVCAGAGSDVERRSPEATVAQNADMLRSIAAFL